MNGKLFYQDPYLKQFSASVLERGVEKDGLHYIILDQTAFYPTGGGQPCDLGTLNGVQIIDVEEMGGKIRHRSHVPVEGVQVAGSIDWARRFDHMQQHTGQHILSAVFEQAFDGVTVGFHLGRETVTIDLNIPEVTEVMVDAVTQKANQIIFENRDVTAKFVDDEELSKMPLRKPPTVAENIRVVIVDGFDYSPCGGTHPLRTGEVGPIQILNVERNRHGVRVEFVCGFRAVHAFVQKQVIVKQCSQLLSSSESEVTDQLARLLNDKREQEKNVTELKEQILDFEAEQLLKNSSQFISNLTVVAATFSDRSMQELQRLSRKMTTLNPKALCLLLSDGQKTQIVCGRGKEVVIPMDSWLRSILQKIGGKGGGNKEMAQGGGESSMDLGLLKDYGLEWLKTSSVSS